MSFQFNSKGFLIPNANIQTTFYEVKTVFADSFPHSSSRQILIENLMTYCLQLMESIEQESLFLWLNGSFVTRKAEPNDIDLVVFLDDKVVQNYRAILDEKFKHPESLRFYGVDAYIVNMFPENHKNHFFTISDRVHWLSWFSQTRANRRGQIFKKGFLEVTLSKHEIQ